tara:strand:+ start:5437 stop:6687 length:1251 start_codon:yes stop_codon:yes gene_type:complete
MSDAMNDTTMAVGKRHISRAVCQNRLFSRQGLSERVFARFFSGLVYAQIWEDPQIDMEAMALGEGHRIVTIASGGCNILAYLTRKPAHIDAVDLNRAHIALNRLKLAAITHLPGHGDVLRFFGKADQRFNGQAYDRFIAPHLDSASRRYWEQRNWRGRRRVADFNRNFYKSGLLGWFITAGHLVARLHGVDPSDLMQARNLREQRHFFEEKLAPLFNRPAIRWVTRSKASLFGLGIPPAQYDELLAAGEGASMARVLSQRLEKLACHFPLRENYFAWQAFARQYPEPGTAALPAYLDRDHHKTISQGAGNVAIHHCDFTDLLAGKAAASVDRYVLLDAQDWMNDRQINALWQQITRTAAPGARVIFRTAGQASNLEGRIASEILDQWHYRQAESQDFCRRDRSAIYGGFHLYEKPT